MFQGNFQLFCEMQRLQESQNQQNKVLLMNMRLNYINETYFKYFHVISSQIGQHLEFKNDLFMPSLNSPSIPLAIHEKVNSSKSFSGNNHDLSTSMPSKLDKNIFPVKNCCTNNCDSNTKSNCQSSISSEREPAFNYSREKFNFLNQNEKVKKGEDFRNSENSHSNRQKSFLKLKKRRFIKENSNCPHAGAKHYAKVIHNFLQFIFRECAVTATMRRAAIKRLGNVRIRIKCTTPWEFANFAIRHNMPR